MDVDNVGQLQDSGQAPNGELAIRTPAARQMNVEDICMAAKGGGGEARQRPEKEERGKEDAALSPADKDVHSNAELRMPSDRIEDEVVEAVNSTLPPASQRRRHQDTQRSEAFSGL